MAEGSDSNFVSDDVVIIPDTPSPVFSKRMAPVSFKSRQPSESTSSAKESKSSLNFSPPDTSLSFPGQSGFAYERADAVRKKKLKDKMSNKFGINGLSPVKRLSPDKLSNKLEYDGLSPVKRLTPDKLSNKLGYNGLSPVKRLSPVKAGFVKSSELLKTISGSDVKDLSCGDSGRPKSACALQGLKRDVSPNIYSPSTNLYERIKAKHKNKVHSRPVTNPSSTYGWPSDSDSDDDILASAVDSVPNYKCKRKTTNGHNLVIKNTNSQTGNIATSPSKSGRSHFHSLLDGEDGHRFVAPNIQSSSYHTTLKTVDRQKDKSSPQACFKSPNKHKTSSNNLLTVSPKFHTTDLLSCASSNTEKQSGSVKHKTVHKKHQTHSNCDKTKHKSTGSGSSKHDWFSTARSRKHNCDSVTGTQMCACSPELMNLTGVCANLTRNSNNNNETSSSALTGRQERKRKHESVSDRSSAKVLKTKEPVKKRTPVKVSSPQATPETQNVISVVNQMEKDEEVARRLQEELDREFALTLQNQAETRDSLKEEEGYSLDSLIEEEGEYRYHSAFGDIRHRSVGSPRRHQWHMYDPLRVSRNRRDDIPRVELEELIADAANSIHAGLEYEMLMGRGRRRGGRRGRGGRGGGGWTNLMFASPNSAGNDYDALMELGEMIGDVKQKGLTKHELQRLPTTIYKADESNGSTECHICMGDYETGDSLKILPCFHSYHGKCIDKWIKQNATCPVCRVEIKLS